MKSSDWAPSEDDEGSESRRVFGPGRRFFADRERAVSDRRGDE